MPGFPFGRGAHPTHNAFASALGLVQQLAAQGVLAVRGLFQESQ